VNSSELESADKKQFLQKLGTIKTLEDFNKALPSIEERIVKLEATRDKQSLARKITKLSDANVPLDYKDQIDDILEGYDLKGRTEKTKQRRLSREDFLNRQKEEGELDFLPDNFFDLPRKTLDEMSLDEVQEIHDKVSNLKRTSEKNKRKS